MIRPIVVAAGFALFASLAQAPHAAAEPFRSEARAAPALKRSATVTEEFVRIGDLIENAGTLADVPVFRSPDLGTTGTVATRRVLDALRPHYLFGVDVGDIVAVEVARAARVIARAEIEARIVEAFAGKFGLGEAAYLTLTVDREIKPLVVEPTATDDLQVARAHYEPRSARFEIVFELPNSAIARKQPLRFSGSLVEKTDVPVLARPIQRGEIVRPGDVTTERRPKGDLPADAVLADDLTAGLAARAALRAGQPLRRGDLVKPELVKRDETVTLLYEAPGILLTARGRASDAGAEGDIVNAVNLQSKRPVQGVVTGPGRISVIGTASRIGVAAASIGQMKSAEDAFARVE